VFVGEGVLVDGVGFGCGVGSDIIHHPFVLVETLMSLPI